jgi:GcrA cell cycle regulator
MRSSDEDFLRANQQRGTLMAWTEPAVETMRRLWPTHSAAEIARAIGDVHGIPVTRNAVIGKGLRAGMAAKRPPASPDGRASTGRRKLQFNSNDISRLQVKVTGGDPGFKERKPTADEQIPIYQRRTLMELTAHTCRWPLWTAGQTDRFFCGAEPVDGLPYCANHMRAAIQPPEKRRRPTLGQYMGGTE